MCAGLLLGGAASAQTTTTIETEGNEPAPTVTSDLFLTHNYIERGMRQFTDMSEALVVDTKLVHTVGGVELSLGFWHGSTSDLVSGRAREGFECPALGAKTQVAGDVALEAGYTTCFATHLGNVDTVQEFSLIASRSIELPRHVTLLPTATLVVDPLRQKGVYGSVSVAASTKQGPVEITTTLSAGASSFAGMPSGFQDLSLGVEARWSVTEVLTLRGFTTVAYSPISEAMHQDPVNGYAGLGVGVAM